MKCNCVRKITEWLLRKDSTLWQHKCESPITVLKISYTLAGVPLNSEALGFSLSSLLVNPALPISITHKYMTTHFHRLLRALKIKSSVTSFEYIFYSINIMLTDENIWCDCTLNVTYNMKCLSVTCAKVGGFFRDFLRQ